MPRAESAETAEKNRVGHLLARRRPWPALRARWNWEHERRALGVALVFPIPEYPSPREARSGQAAGRRRHTSSSLRPLRSRREIGLRPVLVFLEGLCPRPPTRALTLRLRRCRAYRGCGSRGLLAGVVERAFGSMRQLPVGTRIPHPGSRTPDPAPRIPDPGSRTPDPGPRIPDPGSRTYPPMK